MEFYSRSVAAPRRLGVLAGSFNPPTVAHMELVDAAGFHVDEVLCVLPRVFPHKDYSGATREQRLEMLAACDFVTPVSLAISDGSLYIEIARECREHYGPATQIHVLCGTDAAERILNWDYGRPGVPEEMLSEFELLVAARDHTFHPPPRFLDRVRPLHVSEGVQLVSSTDVRERIRSGQRWEHLVPDTIVENVRRIYS